MAKKISSAQLDVLSQMEFWQANTIERQPGGFWTIAGKPKEDFYAGTTTVRAMHANGLLEPCAYYGPKAAFVIAYRRVTQ